MRRWVLLGCAALACSFESSSAVTARGTDTLGASSSETGDAMGSSTTDGVSSSSSTTGAVVGSSTSSSSSSSDAAESSSSSMSGGHSETVGGESRGPDDVELTDDGLVVRYFLNEAPAGSDPSLAIDWADDPFDLSLEYVDSTMHYVSEGIRRGLAFDLVGRDDAARSPIDDSKVAALEGTYELTIEVRVRVDDAATNGSRIVHIGRNDASAVALAATSADRLEARWNGIVVRRWDYSAYQGASRTLHLVIDTSAVNAASRFRLLADGVELNPTVVNELPDDAPLAFANDTILALGNRHRDRTFRGALFYAAIYDHAISDSTLAEHVEVLQLSDDPPM